METGALKSGGLIGRECRRLFKALGYSAQGLTAAWRTQAAFRLDVVVFVLAQPLVFWLGRSGFERALLFSSLVILLLAEMLNSAIETVVDRVGLEHHELSGRAKDMGSAAVLLACMNIAGVWGFLLWDRFA